MTLNVIEFLYGKNNFLEICKILMKCKSENNFYHQNNYVKNSSMSKLSNNHKKC